VLKQFNLSFSLVCHPKTKRLVHQNSCVFLLGTESIPAFSERFKNGNNLFTPIRTYTDSESEFVNPLVSSGSLAAKLYL